MEYVNGYFTPGVPTFTRNFNYCSYDTLDKIKDVSNRITSLIFLRPSDESVYTYKVLCRMYFKSKTDLLGFRKTTVRQERQTVEITRLQNQFKYATAVYNRDKTEAQEFKVRILHRRLLERWRTEMLQNFCNWISKLNKLV